ncbi:MAG: excinuclease ABC subunit UvrC [Spirochaetia bacterium]|nr:excinuclease ABC subunit UvrC [Spirochaetia bacterium]
MDKDILSSLPEKPGVYIFKNSSGDIIYIGKAKVLRNRVRSYFSSSKKDIKTEQLSGNIADLDFIVTLTELEAFILENTLIKQHKPKYNILLKDDKSYPFIKIAYGDKYPGVYVTRNARGRGDVYFGPYYALDAKRVVQLIYRMFRIRQCTLDLTGKPLKRPCIYYDTGLCAAPCVGYVTGEQYDDRVKLVREFLDGNYKPVLEELKKEMEESAAAKKYEKAAEARDSIKAVEEIMKEQKVVTQDETDTDVVNFLYRNGSYYFGVFNIRRGRLVGKSVNVFNGMPENENPLEIFLAQYYSRNISTARDVVLPEGAVETEVAKYIFRDRGVKLRFCKKDRLLDMVMENLVERSKSTEKMEEKKTNIKKEYLLQMEALKESLKLEAMPSVIEAVDISHSSGDHMAGSLVVFKNGEPDRAQYRHFKIKTVGQVDDFASVAEVVQRRYSRLKAEGGKFPDLLMIDGGIGQVNAAKHALDTVGVDIPVIGLAKEHEMVFFPHDNEAKDPGTRGRFLLMRARDEAHRFANSLRTKLANKKMKKSVFDDIKFIGEKTLYMIYNEFKDRSDLVGAIQSGDKRADFLNKRQKDEILKALKTINN